MCPLRLERSWGSEACVSRMVVDKYVYLSKAGSPLVEVWDKRSERMVDCIDCAHVIRYTHTHTFRFTAALAHTLFAIFPFSFGFWSSLEMQILSLHSVF